MLLSLIDWLKVIKARWHQKRRYWTLSFKWHLILIHRTYLKRNHETGIVFGSPFLNIHTIVCAVRSKMPNIENTSLLIPNTRLFSRNNSSATLDKYCSSHIKWLKNKGRKCKMTKFRTLFLWKCSSDLFLQWCSSYLFKPY